MALNNFLNKIKGYVSQNPEKAQQALDKVQSTVDQKTGGKYKDKLDKAGDAASKGLGLPADKQVQPGEAGPQAGQGNAPGQNPTPPAGGPAAPQQ